MKILNFFTAKIRDYFTIWDIKLIQLSAMLILIVLIKIIPQIISLNIWWYVVGAILAAIRPIYVIYFKK